MKNYFISKIESFFVTNNYVFLGEALHCIQDAYSPPHTFQYWDGEYWSYIPHIFEGIFPLRTEREAATNATKQIYESIINSNRTRDDIEQIFDIIDLVNNNMLKIEEGYIFIPEDKLYISNSILVNFIGGSNGNK